MGKSFTLPDISARYNLYSAGLLSAISNTKRDWDLIAFNIRSLNTLLTSRYSIPISTELYNKRKHITQTRSCQHCCQKDYRTVTDEEGNLTKEYFETQTKIPVSEIKLYDVPLSDVEEILYNMKLKTHVKSRVFWKCPKCGNENLASETPKSDVQFDSTATFGVIYDRPRKENLLVSNQHLDIISMKWATDFMHEVDVGMMAYQKAYFDEHGEGMSQNIQPFGHDDEN